MTPEPLAPTFQDFLEREYLRCARQPYDSVLLRVRERIGDLRVCDHIIYSPSPIIGGDEDPASVMRMNARHSMIFNGDIATQVNEAEADAQFTGIDIVEDASGTPRVKLLWAD